MATNLIETELRGRVGIIRLSRPANLNAVSVAMVDEIDAALTELEKSARALLLMGVGKAFSSGADLAEEVPVQDGAVDFGSTLETHMNPLMNRLRDLSIPWISAVRGAAAGVGCSLALAADMVIASETAYFLQAFSRIGLVPDGGSTHLLVRGTSRVRAMEMVLLGDPIPAAQALEWGLVNYVVPDDALEAAAMALAERLANGPSSLTQTRRLMWQALDSEWSRMLALERSEQRTAGRSADCEEGIAAFMEKRPAQFKGA